MRNNIIILRDYQVFAVNRGLEALKNHNNTLLIAPTGAGKTIILSSLISEFIKQSRQQARVLVLQHRKEIIWQNMQKFNTIDLRVSISLINQESKDNSGQVVFGMIQTLHKNLELIGNFSLIAIDEAHHSVAKSYLEIIDAVRVKNPEAKIYGVTATPLRSDKKRLASVFNNISYAITLPELIARGILVKPKQFIIDIGITDKLEHFVKNNTNVSDLQLDQFSSEILRSSTVDINKAFLCWEELAKGRKTVIFTPTIKDSVYISAIFEKNGVKTKIITCDTAKKEREQILNEFQFEDISVLLNTNVLTEGWDCPIASCIVLFKSSSHKSPYIQMVGRGLRAYPGKTDCITIDFGISTRLHGSLEQDVFKSVRNKLPSEVEPILEYEYKKCPECFSEVPTNQKVCFICGFEFENVEEKKMMLEEFRMREVELIRTIEEKCSYAFARIYSDKEDVISSVGNQYYIGIFKGKNDWRVIGNVCSENKRTELYHNSISKAECFERSYQLLNSSNNTSDFLMKDKSWLQHCPTDKQIELIQSKTQGNIDCSELTRHEASCMISYLCNKKYINRYLE